MGDIYTPPCTTFLRPSGLVQAIAKRSLFIFHLIPSRLSNQSEIENFNSWFNGIKETLSPIGLRNFFFNINMGKRYMINPFLSLKSASKKFVSDPDRMVIYVK